MITMPDPLDLWIIKPNLQNIFDIFNIGNGSRRQSYFDKKNLHELKQLFDYILNGYGNNFR